MKGKHKTLLSTMSIIVILLLTLGFSYIVFYYTVGFKNEETSSKANFKYLYDGSNNSIQLIDSEPVSDDVGKKQDSNVFDFKIEALLADSVDVPYEVILSRSDDSNIDDKNVKVYLTEVVDGNEKEIKSTLKDNKIITFNQLQSTGIKDISGKTVYKETIDGNTLRYNKNFRLRIWLEENTKVSKKSFFTVKVNIYANNKKIYATQTTQSIKPTSSAIPVLGCQENNVCNIGAAVILSDGSKWHVLEKSDSDNPMVTLLSDENIKSDGSYDTCQGNIGKKETYSCSFVAFDPNNTSRFDPDDGNNVGYFLKNIYLTKLKGDFASGNLTDISVDLPTIEQLQLADGYLEVDYSLNNTITNGWLRTTNYWTKSNINDDNLRVVMGSNGTFSSALANDSATYGVRPVIKILKSNIGIPM